MQELAKVKRTLSKHNPEAPHESLLVVDATTGSNALVQAKEFHEAIGITGIILTKLDGSGKEMSPWLFNGKSKSRRDSSEQGKSSTTSRFLTGTLS